MDAGNAANLAVGIVFEKAITRAVDAIARQFSYLFCYKSYIKNLEEKVVQLEHSRDDAVRFFQVKKCNNEEKAKSSEEWLKNVEHVIKAAKQVQEAAEKLNGWCLNLKGRYVLSSKSTKVVAEVRKLQVKSPKLAPMNPALPAGMLPGPSCNYGSSVYKTRISTMEEIMNALEDHAIRIIGICGLGGVGKTTMLNEVRARVRKQNLFDEVVMTIVSQHQDLFKIQGDIADMLGLTSLKREKNVIGRADQLRKRLTNGNKTLVILDDVWKDIKLEDIGIPVGSDQTKCKIVISSRQKGVCTSTQKDIDVKVLAKEEARAMFRKTVGNRAKRDNLEEIANEIADECGCLPLALLTVASALSKKERSSWKLALTQLREGKVADIPGIGKEVCQSIKLSYDFLSSENLQGAVSLLLLCCQHPEDSAIEVEKLTRYFLALDLFKFKSVGEVVHTRTRVSALVEHLKSCFLLEAVGVAGWQREWEEERVKVHDVVRDVCLWIASTETDDKDRVYMHAMGREKDQPCTSAVDYSHLKLLIQAPFEGGFFLSRNFQQLRVLESYSGRECRPPPSLEDLKNLRMLSLEDGYFGEEGMSTIGSLLNLKILSFCNSSIGSLPCQIGKLSNLKLLDLRHPYADPGPFPRGILPGLNKLEELYMGNYYFLETPKDGTQGHVSELEFLCNLTTLQTQLQDPMALLDLKRFDFEKLESFYFGHPAFHSSVSPLVKNTLELDRVGTEWVSGAKIQPIVQRTLVLRLVHIDWCPLLLRKFVSLRYLKMYGCDDLKFLIHDDAYAMLSGGGSSSNYLFMHLERLTIREMMSLTELCHNGNLPAGSFRKLKYLTMESIPKMRFLWVGPTDSLCLVNLTEIEIVECAALECIFPRSAAKCLVQLQKLTVENCGMLKGIVSKGGAGTEKGEIIEDSINLLIHFPKLRCVTIEESSNLRGFYNLDDDDDTAQPLFSPLVMLPSMERLRVEGLHLLKQIVGGRMLQTLQQVDVEQCDSLASVFDVDCQQVTRGNVHAVPLYKLETIKLRRLRNLTQIFHLKMQDISVPELKAVYVSYCPSLLNVAKSNLLKGLQNLKQVSVEICESIKAVFDFEGLETMTEDARDILGELEDIKLDNLPKLEYICRLVPKALHVFRNLRTLRVAYCESLTYLFSSSLADMLVNLQNLDLRGCKGMKEVIKWNEECVEKKVVFRSLSRVTLTDLENLLSFCSSELQEFKFPSLKQLFVAKCPEMESFCSGNLGTGKLHGVCFSPPHSRLISDDAYYDEQAVWKSDLNETIRHFNAINRVIQMNSDYTNDAMDTQNIHVPKGGVHNELVQCGNEGTYSKMAKACVKPLESSLPAVTYDNKELVYSSPIPYLGEAAGLNESSCSGELVSWEGHLVSYGDKVLIEAVEKHFPNTFDGVNFHNEATWKVALECFCRFIMKFLVATVYDLSSKEIADLRGMLLDLKIYNFKVDWALDRLGKVENLRFGSSFLEELAEIECRQALLMAKVEDLEGELVLVKEELGNLDVLRETKMKMLFDKLGSDGLDLLDGSLGRGLLPSYQSENRVTQMNGDYERRR